MFETLTAAPPDAILGLNEAFKSDPSESKINLGVGVYKDPTGVTPVLACVKAAERRLVESEQSKTYLPISGNPDYGRYVPALLFGDTLAADRVATIQTPGGTGALRIAGDFIHEMLPGASVWLSNPTWANHPNVFSAAGVPIETYGYFDPQSMGLDYDSMVADLQRVNAGDVVLLHGCCHNPTGVDPSLSQWKEIAALLAKRKALPLVDFAYQGFADGVDEDRAGLLQLADAGIELLVCSSFSKNFGLYGERVGALTLVSDSEEHAQVALSHIKICIRTNYSNPPKHGGAIVAMVLSDPELRAKWLVEVTTMRDRINGMRRLFADTMKAKGVDQDFSFITDQRGMFSFSGIKPEQVDKLRSDYAIYIVRSGRINVAGMTEANMDRLCDAIASVL